MNLAHEQHIARIRDLSLYLNNEDSLGAYSEAHNLADGRPAYWHRGQFSPASALVALSRCVEHNHSLLKAAEAFADRHTQHDLVDVYDGIIPLNEAAVDELMLCYRLQSTFRDRAELADRERKAIFDPVFFPRMRQEMRDEWERLYEGCQQRWADRRDDAVEARKGISPAAAMALTMATIVARHAPDTAVSLDDVARAAVEGEPMSEVA